MKNLFGTVTHQFKRMFELQVSIKLLFFIGLLNLRRLFFLRSILAVLLRSGSVSRQNMTTRRNSCIVIVLLLFYTPHLSGKLSVFSLGVRSSRLHVSCHAWLFFFSNLFLLNPFCFLELFDILCQFSKSHKA